MITIDLQSDLECMVWGQPSQFLLLESVNYAIKPVLQYMYYTLLVR